MKIPLVNVQLGARAKPEDDFMALSVYRQGPDAVPITELPIVIAQSGAEAVTNVSPALDEEGNARFLDTTRSDEFDRLARKFRGGLMARVYPSEAIPLPSSIDHLGLEPWQFAGKAPTLSDKKAKLMADLKRLEEEEAALADIQKRADEAAEELMGALNAAEPDKAA